MRLAFLTVLLAALGTAAPARAAIPALTLATTPREGAILGQATRVTGVLRQDGVPLAGRTVTLEGRAHPFDGPFAPLAAQATRADGRYAFSERLQRNHDLRVVAAAPGPARGRTVRVYVFPRARLEAATLERGVVRLTQTLTVPTSVRLTAPTRFYLGRSGARTAPYRVSARPRRVRAGVLPRAGDHPRPGRLPGPLLLRRVLPGDAGRRARRPEGDLPGAGVPLLSRVPPLVPNVGEVGPSVP